ncbi:MAG: ACP S-malonyltransferase [Chloroflexi bacterium]|nr:ACP S-malonyltransferase [Chloroflexota bacterium]
MNQRKAAFLFPGQGSQSVSMGRDLAEHSASVRRIFETVDEVVGSPLSKLIFEGPESELTKTMNAQPAIMAVSLACLKALQETSLPDQATAPSFVAGHSVGELTAVVASGALDLEDGIRLVRERGLAMQQAAETQAGGMAAVLGMDEITVEEVCQETGVQIANVNAEDQIVIAGDRLALARTLDLLILRGAKRTIALQVSGAFHSRLMEPARARLIQSVRELRFRDPQIPIIANSTAQPLTTGKAVGEELERQLCSSVQWKRSIDYLWQAGVGTFYELGPGRVLSNLLKRSHRDARVITINDLNTIQALAN